MFVVLDVTDNIDNDAGEQLALLVLVRAFLHGTSSALRVTSLHHYIWLTIFAVSVVLSVCGTRLDGCGEDQSG
jgi:hypothetical protein